MSRKETGDWLDAIDERLAGMPSWARPPFYGMLFVYALVWARGGLLIPLVAVLGLLRGGLDALMDLLWLAVALGLAGFAGGLAYAIVQPLLRPLGRVGAVVIGWCTVFAYLVTMLPLVGLVDAESHRFDPADPVSWWIAVALSILFGTVLGLIFMDSAGKPKRRDWVQRKQKVTSRVHPPAG